VIDTYQAIKLDGQSTFLSEVLHGAKDTVKFCPLLSVVFIAARLRANQLQTVPQPWAQTSFYITTNSILGQTIMALMLPLLNRMYGSSSF